MTDDAVANETMLKKAVNAAGVGMIWVGLRRWVPFGRLRAQTAEWVPE